MCVPMHHLAETKGFLLCVYRQYRPLLAEESSVTLHNNDHCLLLLSHRLLKNSRDLTHGTDKSHTKLLLSGYEVDVGKVLGSYFQTSMCSLLDPKDNLS